MMRHLNSMLILYLLGFVGIQLTAGCNSDCCHAGGTCGDAVFDNCLGRGWDYRTSCSPTYLVCCLPHATVDTTTSRPTTGISSTRVTPKISSQTTATGQSFPSTRQPIEPPIAGCGRRPTSRIVGGSNASPHSWPWIAQLQRDYFGWDGWEHFCGATLVSAKWAITAAHCIAKYNEVDPAMFRVVLGEHDRSSLSGSEVIKQISRIIIHDDWSADVRGSPSDLALLELSTPVEFNEVIQPACLPSYPHEAFGPEDDCWISGWGDTKGTGDSNILQEVKINITPYEECREKWLTGTGGKDYIKTSHVCVGNGVPGACNGDSGGPLVCLKDGRFTLVGATSFGAAGCLETDAPNAYTKISHFLPWIMDRISE